MHILMVTASLPYPPHQGGALRSYGILHGLHQAGHKITLLSFHDETEGVHVASTPLALYCERIETVPAPNRVKSDRLRDLLLTDQADIARRLYSENFYQCLKHLIRDNSFDLIQFEGIEVAAYLLLLRRDGVKARLCYDAFNAEAALQQVIAQVDRGNIRRLPAAVYSMIQTRRITQFERDLCQRADIVIAVSKEDAAILRHYRADKRVSVVTNGIFADDYTEGGEQLDLGDHTLVFTGKMDYRPNVDAMVWFTDEVLPLVEARVPDARLYIVGQKPHPRLEKLRARSNIEITGWVQDVQPFLRGASLYVAPLRMGSGTRLKILEAMASGCAIVATNLAISGMRPEARSAMIVVDEPRAMADAIICLLDDQQAQQIGTAAQQFVRQYYDWSALIPDLLTAYQDVGLE